MRLDWRTAAGAIAAAIFVVAYSWQPPGRELRLLADLNSPGPPVPKPSPFEIPKPPELPRVSLHALVLRGSAAPPARSPSRGFKHHLAILWPFRKHAQSRWPVPGSSHPAVKSPAGIPAPRRQRAALQPSMQ